MIYKIAIIGSREAVIGFKAIGFEIYPSAVIKEAIDTLWKLKHESSSEEGVNYAIIFITEDIAQEINSDDYRKLTSEPLPAIITLPSTKGPTGFSLARLGQIVERAVGSDILS